jgi:hypothetical protein
VSSRVLLVKREVVVALLLDFDTSGFELLAIRVDLNPRIFVGQINSAYVNVIEVK